MRLGFGSSLALATLLALCALSCRTITPNDYSRSVGPAAMRADEKACFEHGSAERERLLSELVAGDPAVVSRENKAAAGRSVGGTIGKLEGKSSAAIDLGAAIGGALLSSSDPELQDEQRLAEYLGIKGGTSGFSALTRLKNICLRAKGYEVETYEADGSGTAVLEWDPARVMLREEDGAERIFYQHGHRIDR